MLQDTHLTGAVSKILKRSERQDDVEDIVHTFVDVGILPQLDNRNSQILYGRRGTGKTHVFKYLQARLNSEEKADRKIAVYIDSRTLGSTAQFSDPDLPLKQRCLALFKDILGPIYNTLLEYIFEQPRQDVKDPQENAEKALEAIDRLRASITESVKTYRQESEVRTESDQSENSTSAKLGASSSGLSASATASGRNTRSRAREKSFRVEEEDKIMFPSVHDALSEALRLSNLKLYILLDEWSSIPQDIQPYLAEFLKRSVLPVPGAVLKIATLEHRTKFVLPDREPLLGFELGADIATALDLDDYYVYDRNPEQITNVFADILLKHLTINLPDNHLASEHRINSAKDFASRLFTQRDTFKELARAAEGVVRDLINIFTGAFFEARKRARDTIDKKSVLEASRQWFEQDKEQDLDSTMHNVLRRIVDDVIGEKKARSFLLPKELQDHWMIQKLFDARVLHLVRRGYADKDNPGRRYDIFALDYGTYVDLINTSQEPQIDLFDKEDKEEGTVVPFDDNRSIRRIILDKEVLEDESGN